MKHRRFRSPVVLVAFLAGAFVFPWSSVVAHEGIHEQITRVSGEIQLSATDAALFLRRGELERIAGQWDAAEGDYDAAAALDPSLDILLFARGRLEFERGRPSQSLILLSRYLTLHAHDIPALLCRAEVHRALRHFTDSAADYERVIALAPRPEPEWIRGLSEVLVAAGKSRDALRVLDRGTAILGPLVTLELPAIDLELRLNNVDGALKRVERIAAQSQKKEAWLMRRGDILSGAGRTVEARAAYRQALAEIESLPQEQRQRKSVLDLERRLTRLGR